MNCDPLARWYRWMEYLGMGRALERRRFEFLPEMASARRVLILGEGDGRFLVELLRTNNHAQIDAVDNSAEMVKITHERLKKVKRSGNIVTHGEHRETIFRADAHSWNPPTGAAYDLIVTHFFLDCFTAADLSPLIERFSAAASQQCRWVVSEFRQPSRGVAAWRARIWIGGLYRLFGWTTGLKVRHLPDYAPLLQGHGFRCDRQIIAEMGLLTSELWVRP